MTRLRVPRRRFVAGLAGTMLLPAAASAALPRTPRQTAGPFYPDAPHRLADNDADLVILRGNPEQAPGQVILVSGRVMRPDGGPVAGALVEIWQANAEGDYVYPRRGDRAVFQGYGAATTNADGGYRFRTIKPAAYGSLFFRRTPHIHFKVSGPGIESLTTQMYFAGEARNEDDGILNAVRDKQRRDRLIVPFSAANSAEPGVPAGVFDIVVG